MNRLTITDVRTGLLFYAISSGVVILAAAFGYRFLGPSDEWGLAHRLCQWDGVWYRQIAEEGYTYDSEQPSRVAFFPAYPLAIRAVMELTGWRFEWAALAVAHLFLAASFVLLHAYARLRNVSPPLVLLVFGLWPVTFFFRLGYSEAMFCFWCVLLLYGHERGWKIGWLALVAGAAAGTRAAGVALAVVPLRTLWQQSPTWGRFLRGAAWLGPLSVWGMLAYMLYQAIALGTPLAFIQAQQNWSYRGDPTLLVAARATLLFQPVWEVYDPESFFFWQRWFAYSDPTFSLYAANPIWFVLSVGALAWGWRARWLTVPELLVGVGLLLVPYLTRAYAGSMISFGRFSAVVVPIYLVFGRAVQRLHPGAIGLVAALMTLWLVAYAAQFGGLWWLL